MSLETVKETILNFVLLKHVNLAQYVIELAIANAYFEETQCPITGYYTCSTQKCHIL